MKEFIKKTVTCMAIGAATMAGVQLWNKVFAGKFDNFVDKAKACLQKKGS